MQLSICMMVKNEAKRLNECLTALRPILDELNSELIIVDTGSDDDTVEIAKRHTEKVYFHPWEGDFSGMRNITLSYARGEWVFIVDGDEVLENPKPIIDFINSKEQKKYNTATLKINNLIDEKGKKFAIITAHRIFRKDKDFKYVGKVHNQPIYKGPIKNLDAILVHYGYINDDEELMERKFKRTSTILKNELEKDPENLYYLYQLAESYGMHKEYDKALDPVMKAYNLIEKKELDKKKYLYILIGAGKWNINNKKYYRAKQILEDALEYGADYVDIQAYLGYALIGQDEVEEAIKHLEKYLGLIDDFDNLQSAKDLTVKHESVSDKPKVFEILAGSYYNLKEYEKALKYSTNLELELGAGKAKLYIIRCLFKLNRFEDIYNYYLKLKSTDENDLVKETIKIIEFEIKDKNEYDIKELSYLFSKDNSDYATLCKARIALIEGTYNENLENEIYSMDLHNLSDYFSDIVLYMLENKIDLVPWLRESYEESLNKMMMHLISRGNKSGKIKTKIWYNPVGIIEGKIQDLAKLVLHYVDTYEELNILAHQEENKLEYYRLFKALCRYPLAAYELDDNIYVKLFNEYLYYGRLYIKSIYHPNVINSEKIYHLKSEEDGFLLYMNKAMEIKEKDQTGYIKYLRKALNIFELKRGIELLLQEIEDTNNEPDHEMETLMKQFKDNIKMMIENKMINQAEELIKEYEQIVPDDVEILLFKSQISLNNIEGQDSNRVLN